MHAIHDQPTRPQQSAEVVEFFHSEASTLTERIQDRIHELDQGNHDREAPLRTNLAATARALRHLAATFGFAEPAAAADALLRRAWTADPAELLESGSRLARQFEEAGERAGPLSSERSAKGEEPASAAAAHATADATTGVAYRGEDALRMALELRPRLERAITGNAEARETVHELFDLIRLGLM